jgi:hypothetical protein
VGSEYPQASTCAGGCILTPPGEPAVFVCTYEASSQEEKERHLAPGGSLAVLAKIEVKKKKAYSNKPEKKNIKKNV